MRITFELEPADIARFHEAMARAERRVACAEEHEIVDAARHALATLPIATAPGYVRRRLQGVSRLVDMLEDEAWALPQVERAEVLQLLAYFSDPEDMIPDDVAVIGLLDDAIMIELLMRRMRSPSSIAPGWPSRAAANSLYATTTWRIRRISSSIMIASSSRPITATSSGIMSSGSLK